MKFSIILERTLVSRTEVECEAETMEDAELEAEKQVRDLSKDSSLAGDYDWAEIESEEFDVVEVVEAT